MDFEQYVLDVLKMPSNPFTRPLDVAYVLAHNSHNILFFILIIKCKPTVLFKSFESL
jgi:hypothetical protein